MNISIVIPNYNGEALLKKNLPVLISVLKEYTKGRVEVIISDDASKDNSLAFLKDFITHQKDKHIVIKVLASQSSINSGFSSNVNRGVHAATGEIVILLNTDVVPYKKFWETLLPHFADGQVFAVGCMDDSLEEGRTVQRGRGIGKWEKGFLFHSAGSLDKTNTLWVSGGSGAFRKSIWENLGGLNSLYNPFYWEDIDLSYRAQKCGYKVHFEPKSKVIHEHEKGAIKAQYTPLRIQKIAYRNQIEFVWLNITDKNLLINHILWLPIHLVSALKDKNRAFLLGFSLALFRLPRILAYRSKMSKRFVVSDKKILAGIQA